MTSENVIRCARGDEPADLLLAGARIVNVFSGELVEGSVAVKEGTIVGIGAYEAHERLELGGRFVTPGFIDAHVHIESAMTALTEFARTVMARGTTTVVADPHEIANVLGAEGLRYMLASAEAQPINIYFSLSSCVPATALETAGASLSTEELQPFVGHPRIVALAEMMNYPGVLAADPQVLSKIALARRAGLPVDGHCPALSGRGLNAYVAAGISSDHECTSLPEAREKLAAGMHIMVREGSGARNLAALLPMINTRNSRRMMWCTDDRHPHDLRNDGSIDDLVRRSIAGGLDPITAVQMATLNPAEYFRLHHLGAVAPGRQADLLVVNDLKILDIERVYSRGQLVAVNGRPAVDPGHTPAVTVPAAMRLPAASLDFSIPAAGRLIRVIEIVPEQIVTHETVVEALVKNHRVVSDPLRDILKLVVVDRHSGTGAVGKGFVRGLGLKNGAIAASVAHDSHNLIAAGVEDQDLAAALSAVARMQGGLVAVENGRLLADLPLPIAGLMSEAPLDTICRQLDRLLAACRRLGSPLKDPFMALSFLALPVIPALKLTDQGLVDVERFAIVPLFADV